jgi:hypothetical protein
MQRRVSPWIFNALVLVQSAIGVLLFALQLKNVGALSIWGGAP